MATFELRNHFTNVANTFGQAYIYDEKSFYDLISSTYPITTLAPPVLKLAGVVDLSSVRPVTVEPQFEK